jgi:hypothetical protein
MVNKEYDHERATTGEQIITAKTLGLELDSAAAYEPASTAAAAAAAQLAPISSDGRPWLPSHALAPGEPAGVHWPLLMGGGNKFVAPQVSHPARST